MTSARLLSIQTGLGVFALLCWVVMFLAGHDVWHDLGSPDIWNLQGPPYHDLRVFGVTFYILFFVLLAHTVAVSVSLVRTRSSSRRAV